MLKLEHIIGTDIPYKLKLRGSTGLIDLQGLHITFRGRNAKGSFVSEIATPAVSTTEVAISLTLIVQAASDNFVRGRFIVEFPDGRKKATREIWISVRG